MKGPTRLILEDPDFARLVAASTREEPSSDQMEKALSTATSAAAASRWSLAWGSGLAGRLTIGLAAVGIAVAIGFTTMHRGESTNPVAVPASPVAAVSGAPPAVVAPAHIEVAPPVAQTASVPVEALADAPAAEPSSPKRIARNRDRASADFRALPERAAVQSSSAGSAGTSSFAEELALVSAARAALEKGDVADGLRAIDAYDARFRSGTFAQEMAVMRIEALASSGERARARELAMRFLEANAKSPYAARVRSLLERTPN